MNLLNQSTEISTSFNQTVDEPQDAQSQSSGYLLAKDLQEVHASETEQKSTQFETTETSTVQQEEEKIDKPTPVQEEKVEAPVQPVSHSNTADKPNVSEENKKVESKEPEATPNSPESTANSSTHRTPTGNTGVRSSVRVKDLISIWERTSKKEI